MMDPMPKTRVNAISTILSTANTNAAIDRVRSKLIAHGIDGNANNAHMLGLEIKASLQWFGSTFQPFLPLLQDFYRSIDAARNNLLISRPGNTPNGIVSFQLLINRRCELKVSLRSPSVVPSQKSNKCDNWLFSEVAERSPKCRNM